VTMIPIRPNFTVRGTAAEQQQAKEIIAQWNEVRMGLDQPTAVVYELKHLAAEEVQTQLVRLVPRGAYTVGATPSQLLARATPEEHELIAQLLDQIDKEEAEDNMVVAVYELPGRSYAALQRLFEKRLLSQIRLAPGGRDHVIVRATPENQAKVQRVIDQVAPVIEHKPHTVIYRMQHADPREVSQAVRGVAPEASIVVQTESQSLAVSAYDRDHERISAAIRAIDLPAEQGRERQITVVPIESAEPQALLALLTKTYSGQRDLNFSYDASTHSILIVGRPEQHEEIKQIIAGADAAEKDPQSEVVVYSLGRIQGSIVRRMLQDIMVKENIPPSLSLESNGNRLIAKATQKQHGMIQQVLDQLRPQEIEFEVFSLEVIDPMTADQIIARMFTSSTEGGMPPMVDADTANYRLYVRATSEQIERIRKLLTRMGEKNLAGTDADSQDSGKQTRVRFVPLADDSEAVMKSIRAVWSRLRKNELKLIETDDALPPEFDSDIPGQKQEAVPPVAPPAQPGAAEQGALDAPRSNWVEPHWLDLHWAGLTLLGPICQVAAVPEKDLAVQGAEATGEIQEVPAEGQEATGQEQDPDDEIAVGQIQAGQGGASEPTEKSDPVDPPPIYILAGDQGVTLMSEDVDALNQLERLFATIARPQTQEGGRRFFVYTLKSALATRLATTLNKLYQSIPSYGSSYRSGRRNRSTAFVADDRLNSLIVFANRGDRDEIVELLKILDDEQSPDLQQTKRPVVIPLEHARVEIVEKQVRALYKTQLTAGGKQPTMEIPSGTDAVVAAMIEQVNAIRQGPLMTLDLDMETNALLVSAPAALMQEVKSFVESLDKSASDNPRRAVRIMSLKEMNASEMDKALRRILRDRRR
jgi:type II secretory pathway component GspD/PulD (secretin)